MSHPHPYYYKPASSKPDQRTLHVDVCVYGGNAAGVIAAVQVRRSGRTVVLLENGTHLGGLNAGGLSATDMGHASSIGGLSREFYSRVSRKYGVKEEWLFEPHVAEEVFHEMIKEAGVPVCYGQFLKSVSKKGGAFESVAMESGLTVHAKMFIDATYEGDLMARAGVSYQVGREPNRRYGEALNGMQISKSHQFDLPVDPYLVEGDVSSGLLPGINPGDPGQPGDGDHRVQAYNFRLCLTNQTDNRIPFPKPEGYDAQQYTLLARYLAKGWDDVFGKFDPICGHKVDMNNRGAVSTDYIGMNHEYPDADYATREKIFQAHVTYQQGLMWFYAHDPRVPKAIQDRMNEWGLCRDEFVLTGGWPHQLYIREARRMLSDYVMTEHHCWHRATAEDSVGLASYGMDSHNCQRFVRDGRVWNEGDVQLGGFPPYPISYRAIIPRQGECVNLVVPVCLSASHIAYGSIRMEPVFMILGQSAAIAAILAMNEGVPLQNLPYPKLEAALEQNGQILTPPVTV